MKTKTFIAVKETNLNEMTKGTLDSNKIIMLNALINKCKKKKIKRR